MSMRTNAHLYDTATIHRTPEWNHPAPTKHAVGDEVVTRSGEVGVINSILPAPPTSEMRCREHCYYVVIQGKDRVIWEESALHAQANAASIKNNHSSNSNEHTRRIITS